MPTSKPGGAGSEFWGDPAGAGGPLHVVRARAVEGQTVRVTFDEEPVHRSPAGAYDALNPANYAVAVISGSGRSPRPVGVDRDPILAPAFTVTSASFTTPIVITTSQPTPFVTGESLQVANVLGNLAANNSWLITKLTPTTFSLNGSVGTGVYTSGGTARREEMSFDVHFDVQLVFGLGFRVTVNNVRSKVGGLLGAPVSADFVGVVRVASTRLPQRPLELMDFKSDVFIGGLFVDDSGDIAPHGGAEGYRKRIVRRLMTPKNAFAFLPGYGLGQSLKKPFSVRAGMDLKQDMIEQIMLEPETGAVEVSLQMNPLGALFCNIKARTKKGALIELDLGRGADDEIVVS